MLSIKQFIKQIGFKLYLTRPYNFFTTLAHARAYQKALKKDLGFNFRALGYLSNGRVTEILCTDLELKGLDKIIRQFIIKKPQEFLELIKKGKNFNQLMARLVKEKNNFKNKVKRMNSKELISELNHLFEIYSKQFFTTTALPFRAGVMLNEIIKDKSLSIYKTLLIKVNALRLVTAYISFEKFIIGTVLREIARRNKIRNYHLLFNLSLKELANFTLGLRKYSKKQLEARKFFANFNINNKQYFFWGKKNYLEYKEVLLPVNSEVNGRIKQLSGTIAYRGLTRGKVKVLFSENDVKKFHKGEILVSINSNPRFMAAIKKAAGIISDEGGITCHAAIISREMKIPCIIGTKIATKVLKDGDLVEVDANKGIVKILK